MSKEERELTPLEDRLLHVLFEHLAVQAIPPIGVALMELEELVSQDERIQKFYDLLYNSTRELTEAMRELLDSIPGVIVPTPEEIKTLVAESIQEQQFMQILEQSLKLNPNPTHLN